MRWLPRFYLSSTMMCLADGEAEGRVIGLAWGPVIIELSVARRTPPGRCATCGEPTDPGKSECLDCWDARQW